MMYSEFIAGVGCRDNDYNYGIYKALEAIYMEHEEISKTAVYEAARGLVSNEETPEEKEIREGWQKEIAELEKDIAHNLERIDWINSLMDCRDAVEQKIEKRHIRNYKEQNKRKRAEIRELKWLLSLA